MRIIRWLMLLEIIRFSGLCSFAWYRKFVGGRWERWYIEPCRRAIWLELPHDVPNDYRQPCSVGPLLAREVYP